MVELNDTQASAARRLDSDGRVIDRDRAPRNRAEKGDCPCVDGWVGLCELDHVTGDHGVKKVIHVAFAEHARHVRFKARTGQSKPEAALVKTLDEVLGTGDDDVGIGELERRHVVVLLDGRVVLARTEDATEDLVLALVGAPIELDPVLFGEPEPMLGEKLAKEPLPLPFAIDQHPIHVKDDRVNARSSHRRRPFG